MYTLNVILEIISKWCFLIVTAGTPFIYTLDGDFVFDDSEAIIKNKDVFSESWSSPFFNDFWGTDIQSNSSHKSYRPLTVLSFRLNYILNNRELSSEQFKVTNLLLHGISTSLVWWTYEVIAKDYGGVLKNKVRNLDVPYVAALLFAVHPIHVEAVSGIVGRADVLACIMFQLSFLCYRKAMDDKTNFMYVYSMLCVLLAAVSMLFKENGLTVLGFCVSYEIIALKYLHNCKKKKSKAKNNCRYKSVTLRIVRMTLITIFLMTLLYGRWLVMGGTKPVFKPVDNPAAFSNSLFTKVMSFSYIYFLNFLLLIWPQWLCYDWSMGCVPLLESILDYRIVFVLLLYAYGILLLRTAFIQTKNGTGGVILVALALIGLPFLPAANIFYPVGFVVAERILYIPSSGYCLLIAFGFQKVRGLFKGMNQKTKLIAFAFVMVVYSWRGWQRSAVWREEKELFLQAVPVCPLNAKVRYNLAKVIGPAKGIDLAEGEYREALRLHPKYYQAMNNLANILRDKKQYAEAERHLINAVSLKKDFPAAWMNLGIVLANMKRHAEAETAYETALSYRKHYPDCLFNLGNLYLEMNRLEEASDSWLRAVSLNTKHALAWTNLFTLFVNTEQHDKVFKYLHIALANLPESPAVNFAAGTAYGRTSRFEEAESYYLKALQLVGTKAKAEHYSNLGVLYHQWKKYDKAEKMYQKALQINPNYASAIRHLKTLQGLRAVK